MPKPKNTGTTLVELKAERNVGSSAAGCDGYYMLVEHKSKDRTEQINTPSVFKLIQRALGDHPPIGSEFEIVVTVKVVKRCARSKRACHNPWPSHICRRD